MRILRKLLNRTGISGQRHSLRTNGTGPSKDSMETGQSATEYLLMLSVIVGAVVVVGFAIKKFMPQLFDQISNMISGAAGSLGTGGQ